MTLLAFDTCFGAVSVAVRYRAANGDWSIREAYEARQTGHAERLMPMIAETMAGAGLEFNQIERFAVTVGPGSFTGVRVGVAAARAFALAAARPVVGISSLEVIAARGRQLMGARADGRTLMVAIDARRGGLYCALHRDGTTVADTSPMLLTPEAAIALARDHGALVIGSGGPILADHAAALGHTIDIGAGLHRASRTLSGAAGSGSSAHSRSGAALSAQPRCPPAAGPDRETDMTDAPSRAAVSLLWSSPDDAPAIATLHATLFPTPWEADAVRALIEHPAAVSLIAALPGRQIVGFVIAQIAADEAEILSIGVAPDAQRQGIGRKLVDGTLRAASRAEARRLYLDVAASNAAARALYAACGFTEAGLRKAYYTLPDGGREDAFLLARDIARV